MAESPREVAEEIGEDDVVDWESPSPAVGEAVCVEELSSVSLAVGEDEESSELSLPDVGAGELSSVAVAVGEYDELSESSSPDVGVGELSSTSVVEVKVV